MNNIIHLRLFCDFLHRRNPQQLVGLLWELHALAVFVGHAVAVEGLQLEGVGAWSDRHVPCVDNLHTELHPLLQSAEAAVAHGQLELPFRRSLMGEVAQVHALATACRQRIPALVGKTQGGGQGIQNTQSELHPLRTRALELAARGEEGVARIVVFAYAETLAVGDVGSADESHPDSLQHLLA